MKNMFFKWSIFLISSLLLTAFSTGSFLQPAESLPPSTIQPTETQTSNPNPSQPISVVYISRGEIKLWDETSNQSQTLFSSGDVISLRVSDDSQRIAFIRRSVIKLLNKEWHEELELWVMDRNGQHPRQLMAAERLREFLDASEIDSSGFHQVEWIPHTHDLLFSGTKYIAQKNEIAHPPFPQGVFLVETDTGSITTLSIRSLHFSASPDGQQIALMSATGLSFIKTNGSNYRTNVLTYPFNKWNNQVFPSGVWTEDNRAFLISSISKDETYMDLELVSTDGSSVETLAIIDEPNIYPYYYPVTYSPDGKYAAYLSGQDYEWHITTLDFEVGSLEIPYTSEAVRLGILWSPTGDAYTLIDGKLARLCPDATQGSDICETITNFDGITSIKWIDDSTILCICNGGRHGLYIYRINSKPLFIEYWIHTPLGSAGSELFDTVR